MPSTELAGGNTGDGGGHLPWHSHSPSPKDKPQLGEKDHFCLISRVRMSWIAHRAHLCGPDLCFKASPKAFSL